MCKIMVRGAYLIEYEDGQARPPIIHGTNGPLTDDIGRSKTLFRHKVSPSTEVHRAHVFIRERAQLDKIK